MNNKNLISGAVLFVAAIFFGSMLGDKTLAEENLVIYFPIDKDFENQEEGN